MKTMIGKATCDARRRQNVLHLFLLSRKKSALLLEASPDHGQTIEKDGQHKNSNAYNMNCEINQNSFQYQQ